MSEFVVTEMYKSTPDMNPKIVSSWIKDYVKHRLSVFNLNQIHIHFTALRTIARESINNSTPAVKSNKQIIGNLLIYQIKHFLNDYIALNSSIHDGVY